MKISLFIILLLSCSEICLCSNLQTNAENKVDKISIQSSSLKTNNMQWNHEACKITESHLIDTFQAFCNGIVSPSIQASLSNYQSVDCLFWKFRLFLIKQPQNKKNIGIQTFINAIPQKYKAYYSIELLDMLSMESLNSSENQRWLINSILQENPIEPLYFFLSDHSIPAIKETLEKRMKLFNKKEEIRIQNLTSLVSAAFLASKDDKNAIQLLTRLLETRDINDRFDHTYLIFIAGLSGHPIIFQRLKDIILTDNRTFLYGIDCIPQKASFDHAAACVYSLSVEGFPKIDTWDTFTPETKETIKIWFNSHPTFEIRCQYNQYFTKTPLLRITKGARKALKENIQKANFNELIF